MSAFEVNLEVAHKALDEERRRVKHERGNDYDADLDGKCRGVDAHNPVRKLPAAAGRRLPYSESTPAHRVTLHRGAHRLEVICRAHAGIKDGQIADLEAGGGVAQHHDAGCVGK